MEISNIASLIQRASSYIDSVELQQNRFFRSSFVKPIQAECGSTYGPTPYRTFGNCMLLSLWLHQPRRAAVAYVRDHGLSTSIVRVHVANDLITASKADAQSLQTFLVRHLFPFGRPTESITWKGSTTYFGYTTAFGPGVSVCIYADRQNKVGPEGSPCCHIEWRFSGARALQAACLRSPSDLLALNHTRFWSNHIRLVQTPTSAAIGELWLKAFLAQSDLPRRIPFGRSQVVRRVASLFLRPNLDADDGQVRSNHDLAVYLPRKFFPRRTISALFRPAPTEWLLPPPENAIWDLESQENQ